MNQFSRVWMAAALGVLAGCGSSPGGVAGSGSGSGGGTIGGNTDPPAEAIQCESTGTGCECAVRTGTPEGDLTCSQASGSGSGSLLCCADEGWPSEGATCRCDATEDTTAPFTCWSAGDEGDCLCDTLGSSPGGGWTQVTSCTSPTGTLCCKTTYGFCSCNAESCNATDTVVDSCTTENSAPAPATCAAGLSSVTSCGTTSALGSDPGASTGGASSSTPDDAGGSGPICAKAGPGTCADTASLNHCNCGAGCYRDTAYAGSGYACHVLCTSNADCQNFYNFPTTCQPFTADTGSQLSECRQ